MFTSGWKCDSLSFASFSSSSSSDTVQGSVLLPHYRTILEWEVESTTVTHSSADWWDLLLPLA